MFWNAVLLIWIFIEIDRKMKYQLCICVTPWSIAWRASPAAAIVRVCTWLSISDWLTFLVPREMDGAKILGRRVKGRVHVRSTRPSTPVIYEWAVFNWQPTQWVRQLLRYTAHRTVSWARAMIKRFTAWISDFLGSQILLRKTQAKTSRVSP